MTTGLHHDDLAILEKTALFSSRKAADALSRFSGCRLAVSHVTATVTPIEKLATLHGDPESVVVGIYFGIEGDLEGSILAIYLFEDALMLIEALTGSRPANLEELGELEQSALAESGNILVSTFLSAHEALCGLEVMPSPPSLVIEMCGAVMTSAVLPAAGDEVLMLSAEIQPNEKAPAQTIACQLIFLPTEDSWNRIRLAFRREEG